MPTSTHLQVEYIISRTTEQGDWKRTIDHYLIIICEHTMLVVGVFLFEELKTCPKMFQNRIKLDIFPEHMGLYQTEYNLNAIFK